MSRKLAITGHRPHKLDNDYKMTGLKCKNLFVLIDMVFTEQSATEIIVGMAQGTDTIGALVAINRGFPLTCAIPFRGQERLWPKRAQDLYNKILAKASRVVVVHEGPMPTKPWEISDLMNARNRWMVDELDAGQDKLVGVWDGSAGGTKNCIQYAASKQPPIDIICINPNELTICNYNSLIL